MSATTTWPVPLTVRPRLHQIALGSHTPAVTLDRYRLLGFWCLHVFPFPIDVRINGQRFALAPGWASVVPPDADHEYDFRGPGEHLYAHFSFPDAARTPLHPLPAALDLGERYARVWQELTDGIGFASTSPLRAEIRLWDVLWQLAAVDGGGAAGRNHPAVREACRIIEQTLTAPLSVADLAGRVGVSHNQLTRLFRAAHGTTVVAYIRGRRVQRARHLLVNTTASIRSIAAAVGLPDPHVFNKTVRQATGRSPSALRAARR
jgi:AraC family transcriptional regulator